MNCLRCHIICEYKIFPENINVCENHLLEVYNELRNCKYKKINYNSIIDIKKYKISKVKSKIIKPKEDIICDKQIPSIENSFEKEIPTEIDNTIFCDKVNNIEDMDLELVKEEITNFLKTKYDINLEISNKITKDKKNNVFYCSFITDENKKSKKLKKTDYIIKIANNQKLIDDIYWEYCMYNCIKQSSNYNLLKDHIVEIVNINNILMFHRVFERWSFIIYKYHGLTLTEYIKNEGNISKEIISQMFDIVEKLNNCGIICFEMHPNKFIVDENNIVKYYGLHSSRKWADSFGDAIPQTEAEYIPSKTTCIHFCSINSHDKLTTSRNDDIECLLYICLNSLGYELPWMSMTSNNKIKDTKQSFIDYPSINSYAATEICNFIKNANFQKPPEYNSLKQLFMQL